MKNYEWYFTCGDNGGKKQNFIIKASDKTKAIAKGFEKAKKQASGDIIKWDCKLKIIF